MPSVVGVRETGRVLPDGGWGGRRGVTGFVGADSVQDGKQSWGPVAPTAAP